MAASHAQHPSAMRSAGVAPLQPVLRAGARGPSRSGVDAAAGRGVSAASILWLEKDGAVLEAGGASRQSQESAAITAENGPAGGRPQAADHGAGAGSQGLSVSLARAGDHAAQSGVVQRYYLCAAAGRILVPGGGDGLVQPARFELAVVEQPGGGVLPRGAGRGPRPRQAGDLQHRPGRAVHEPRVRGSPGRGAIAVSMDGRGRARDNIFIERLWRTVKYEDINLKEYASGADCHRGLHSYFKFYSHERPHQALDYRTPYEVHCSRHPRRPRTTI